MTEDLITGFSTMTSSIEFADNYNNWILDTFKTYIGKNILEVGTGSGNFKKYLSKFTNQYVSIDIDPDVIARAKSKDPDGNYFVADASSPEFSKMLKSYNFDTVLCVNVFEHIPGQKEAMDSMLSVLKPGGHLLIFVPAFMSLYSDMDRLVGHVKRYTKKTMKEVVPATGCKIEKIEYFNPVGGFGWWVNKFKKHDNINSKGLNRQVLIFDKYLVPVSKAFNIFTRSFFGQSLLIVLKKT